ALRGSVQDLIAAGGYAKRADELATPMLNWIGYINETSVSRCDDDDQDQCFGSHDSYFGTPYTADDIRQSWRLWPYQVCTQWGFLQTGSGVPADRLPLISRTIDVEYSSIVCREAFNRSEPADLDAVNRHGGFGLAYPRLAFVDGEWDPWRAAGVHARGLPPRPSTPDQPYLLIDRAVHHWDENGVFANETRPGLPPRPVARAQAAEREFVRKWVADFHEEKKRKEEEEGSPGRDDGDYDDDEVVVEEELEEKNEGGEAEL
ncbi:hypothetical protein F4780DRAFT_781922, partial [Xylariomycetidae sp. FL0641]